MSTEGTTPAAVGSSEGLGPLVERLLRYSDIRRNDPRENREALRDLILSELRDALADNERAVREAMVADGWPKLTAPARVGNGTFGVGVSARLVVEAAQRQHQYKQARTPDAEREHAEALACAMEFVRERQAKAQALIDAGKCPDCEGAGEWGGQFTGGVHACDTCGGTGRA